MIQYGGREMCLNAKVQKMVQELNVIDDAVFEKMAEDKGFCEEMLSTILRQ